MKYILLITVIILISFLFINSYENFQSGTSLETYDIIIIAGQSNSVGFGSRNNTANNSYGAMSAEDLSDPNIKMYCKDGTIRNAQHPIDSLHGWSNRTCILPITGTTSKGPVGNSSDNCNKVGLSLTFAKDYIKSTKKINSKVLIIGCGYGGTGFINPEVNNPFWWRPTDFSNYEFKDTEGRLLKDSAGNTIRKNVGSLYLMTKSKLTEMKAKINANSKVVAFLWHQGESDASYCAKNEQYKTEYINHITRLFSDLRNDIRTLFPNSTNVPILMGGLCPDMYINRITRQPITISNTKKMSDFIKDRVVPRITNCKFVSAEPMEPLSRFNRFLEGDAEMDATGNIIRNKQNLGNIHFSASSLREYGKRYFSIFNTMV